MKYTNQEVFDKVVRHIIAQGHPAIEDGGCVYLAPNGDRCAAGCLIPEEINNNNLEGDWIDLTRENKILKDLAYPSLVLAMQMAHDIEPNSLSWRRLWVKQMYKVAATYFINSNVLAELATEEWKYEARTV